MEFEEKIKSLLLKSKKDLVDYLIHIKLDEVPGFSGFLYILDTILNKVVTDPEYSHNIKICERFFRGIQFLKLNCGESEVMLRPYVEVFEKLSGFYGQIFNIIRLNLMRHDFIGRILQLWIQSCDLVNPDLRLEVFKGIWPVFLNLANSMLYMRNFEYQLDLLKLIYQYLGLPNKNNISIITEFFTTAGLDENTSKWLVKFQPTEHMEDAKVFISGWNRKNRTGGSAFIASSIVLNNDINLNAVPDTAQWVSFNVGTQTISFYFDQKSIDKRMNHGIVIGTVPYTSFGMISVKMGAEVDMVTLNLPLKNPPKMDRDNIQFKTREVLHIKITFQKLEEQFIRLLGAFEQLAFWSNQAYVINDIPDSYLRVYHACEKSRGRHGHSNEPSTSRSANPPPRSLSLGSIRELKH